MIVASLFVFCFSCTTSPLYEHHPFWFHGDSGIFQEMGVCLLQGGIPYVNLFEHKGPILFFIQALGLWINPQWGIMLLQILALACTLVLWYEIALLLTNKKLVSIIISIVGLLFLIAFYQRGNLCEEWSLPFLSLPIYLYIKHDRSTSTKRQAIYNHKDILITGLSVGILAMIRLNNTAPLIGFVVWHLIRCNQEKEYKRFWADVAILCLSIIFVFASCALFFLIKSGWNAVYEMIYGTFIFNFIYIGGKADLPLWERAMHYIPIVGTLLITATCLLADKTTINTSLPTVISLIISSLAIGCFGFLHYMMIFVPLIIISIGLVIKVAIKWLYFVIVGIIVFSLYLGSDAADLLLFRIRGKEANTELNDGFHRFVSSIPPEERKSIYNAGLNHMGAGLFADENIYQCNRFIYKNHYLISKRLYNYSLTHGIDRFRPTWVLTQEPKHKIEDKYLLSHYIISDSIPGGEYDTIWCWHKKD